MELAVDHPFLWGNKDIWKLKDRKGKAKDRARNVMVVIFALIADQRLHLKYFMQLVVKSSVLNLKAFRALS